MSAIEGKVLTVTVKGKKLDCQTDGTLTINKDVSTDEPCKDAASGNWSTKRVTAKSWSISVTARIFLQKLATLNELDIIDFMIADDEPVEVEWLSTPGQHDGTLDVVLSGEALITNFTWNAPSNALSTQTINFDGTGPLAKAEIPVVVTP